MVETKTKETIGFLVYLVFNAFSSVLIVFHLDFIHKYNKLDKFTSIKY